MLVDLYDRAQLIYQDRKRAKKARRDDKRNNRESDGVEEKYTSAEEYVEEMDQETMRRKRMERFDTTGTTAAGGVIARAKENAGGANGSDQSRKRGRVEIESSLEVEEPISNARYVTPSSRMLI